VNIQGDSLLVGLRKLTLKNIIFLIKLNLILANYIPMIIWFLMTVNSEISIQIRKLEGDKYHLATNQYGAIFLGSLFKTILEEFNSNMESIVSKKIKDEFESKLAIKCSNCENLNLSGSRYCNNCGTGLDDVSTNHRKSER